MMRYAAVLIAFSAVAVLAIEQFGPLMGPHLRYQLSRRPNKMAVDGDAEALKDFPPSVYHQKVDHTAGSTNTGTFAQRYWVNDTHFKGASSGGPVYLFIEGEGPSTGRWVRAGHMVELAEKNGALLVSLEHRFYGLSNPTPDLSTNDLKLLTSQQALADLAQFSDEIRAQYSLTADNVFYSFGGSYAGALSSWFRLKHPDSVYAAISSSGPVQAKLHFDDYDNVIHESYANPLVGGSQACVQSITTAFANVTSLLRSNDPAQWHVLDRHFHLCGNITSFNDTVVVGSSMADTIKGIAQYNLNTLYGFQIESVCAIMTNTSAPKPNSTPLERLGVVFGHINTGINGSCMDPSYYNMVAFLSNTTIDVEQASRQWTFQTCNEFGYFQACDVDEECMFSDLETVKYYTDLCTTLFGIDAATTAARIDATNAYYGAKAPFNSTRVFFINGLIDPWHALSILTPYGSEDPAITIADGSHCSDMSATKPTDPADLTAARVIIDAQIAKWQSAVPKPDNDNGGLTTAAKIGIAVGVVGFVLIAGVVVWYCRRSKSGGSGGDDFGRLADSNRG